MWLDLEYYGLRITYEPFCGEIFVTGHNLDFYSEYLAQFGFAAHTHSFNQNALSVSKNIFAPQWQSFKQTFPHCEEVKALPELVSPVHISRLKAREQENAANQQRAALGEIGRAHV